MKDFLLDLLHGKKYKLLKQNLDELNESDVAELFEEFKPIEAAKCLRLMGKDKAVLVFGVLDVNVATDIVECLSDKEIVSIIEELPADDATDILEEMPASIVDELLKKCSLETRKDINKLLNYNEDSAGSIMTVEYVSLKESLTVKSAISRIKAKYNEYETINICYVVDEQKKLLGYIEIADLLFASPRKKIKSILKDDLIFVNTTTDQEEVAHTFQKYDITVMPVVDSENRIVGIITIDDVIDVIEEETTEDINKMAAITPVDTSYDKTGVFTTFKSRIPWLLLLMISATFTGKIIESFEDKLAACTILTAFIPMIMDTGGNAGGQASVSIIRALSLNDIEFKDIFKVFFKEFRIAILCSVVLAICNFAKMMFIDHVSTLVALTVCLTLCLTVIIAKSIGCMLPMVAKKIGFDPAVMASPFITTIVDACSLIIYFEIATTILGI